MFNFDYGNASAVKRIIDTIEGAGIVEVHDNDAFIGDVYDQVNYDTCEEKHLIKCYQLYRTPDKARLYFISIYGAYNQWLFKVKMVDDFNMKTKIGLPPRTIRGMEYCHNYGGYDNKKPYEEFRKQIDEIIKLAKEKQNARSGV